MRLNKKLEYALIVLKHLKCHIEQLTSVKAIAGHYDIAFDTTSKVMQALVQKGILQSTQGAKGGYRLTDKLNDLSLEELILIVSGPIQIAKCLKNKCAKQSICTITEPIFVLNERLRLFYRNIPVVELLDSCRDRKRDE